MPKQPPCVQFDAGVSNNIQIYCKPKSSALFIRIQDLDWLISYAADQHHFQGIARGADVAPKTAVAACQIEWDYNAKALDVIINAGPDAGLTLKSPLGAFTKDAFDKVNETQHNVHMRCWSKAYPASKRKMCREYLEMWCDAAAAGTRHEFETQIRLPSRKPC